jgi:hypothetical protein
MEQMIDFDSWLSSFIQKEIEYYVIYDPDTLGVIGIYPDHAANDIEHKLKIDKETAEMFFDGKISLTSRIVDRIDDKLQLVTVNSLVKLDDVLHRIPDANFVKIDNVDVSIKFLFDESLIKVQLSNIIKQKKSKLGTNSKLKFIICSYNDPHIIYQTIDVMLDQLCNNDIIIPYTGNDSRFSIFTTRAFKNYIFEKI